MNDFFDKEKTVAAMTLGCKVNYCDTEAMLELFKNDGYKIVDFEENADVYLINTCTVTNLSSKKSRQMIHRAKSKNKNAIIVVAGCYAQNSAETLIKEDGADIVIGTENKNQVVNLVNKYMMDKQPINNVNVLTRKSKFENMQTFDSHSRNRTRAFIKIQDGCNQFCSYCIIPYVRGNPRSRTMAEILNEIKSLAENNFHEVVLTGIHVASYGKDLDKNLDLIRLLENIQEIDGIERIRLSSIDPCFVDKNFLSSLKNLTKLCDHFHLSLQSGSDKILRSMNRKYTTTDFLDKVMKLRDVLPNVSITTDIIVGFPGETENDFEDTCSFAHQVSFAKIHVFPYSLRNGTVAASMPDKVESIIKKQRVKKLMDVSNKTASVFLKKFVGKTMSVLVERQIDKNIFEGYTTNYLKTKIQLYDENSVNKIIDVNVTDFHNNDCLLGNKK